MIFFKSKNSIKEINYESRPHGNQLIEPAITQNSKIRVNAQSSVLIYLAKGYIEEHFYKKIIIRRGVKKEILAWLEKFHNINKHTIYNDLIGFIQDEEKIKESDIEFYQRIIKQELGKQKAAIRDYDKTININPLIFEAYSNRGNAKLALKQNIQAIKDFNQAIMLNPRFAAAYLKRSHIKLIFGDIIEAIVDCNKVIQINPQIAKAFLNHGNVKLILKRYKPAIKDFDKALVIDSGLTEAYFNRSEAIRKLDEN